MYEITVLNGKLSSTRLNSVKSTRRGKIVTIFQSIYNSNLTTFSIWSYQGLYFIRSFNVEHTKSWGIEQNNA